MRARIVKVAEMDPRDIALWSKLLRVALNPYPYLDPRMVLPSVRLRPNDHDGDMELIVVEDNDEFIALMPFERKAMAGRLKLAGVSTRSDFLATESSWDHPLIHSERSVEACEALLKGLRTLRLPRLIEFATFPWGGQLEVALVEATERLNVRLLERDRAEYAYARRSTPASRDASPIGASEPSFALEHASARMRKQLAKRSAALVARVGDRLRIEDRGADPVAVDQFIELQAAGWKGDPQRGGWGLKVRGYERWFAEVASLYRADGDLAIYVLSAGSETIHIRVMFRIGETMFAYQDAYNERFAEFAPGTLGRAAAINRAFREAGIERYEPNLAPAYVESSRLYPDRQTRVKLLVANGGPLATSVVRTLPAARSLLSGVGRPA
jgi:hypothetical protein